MIEIRPEQPDDFAAIHELHNLAFGQRQEANIVEALRTNGALLLSLVAIVDGKLVGHIVYSAATIGGDLAGVALGPMAVLPDHQRSGIGSKLIEEGNLRLKHSGHPFIVVVGHAAYYPRFGFVPASSYGIKTEWEVPDDVFMVLILNRSRMEGIAGLAKFRNEFSTVA